MAFSKLFLASLASSASAVKLYVSSYAPTGSNFGSVTTLDFTPGVGAASIKNITANQECGSAPTWLDQSLGKKILICLDEGFATPLASLNTLTVNPDGSLKRIATVDTIQGPVATQFYNKNSAIALAHYGGSAISTFKASPEGTFTPLQNFTFKIPPGPRPEQDSSHVHETVIDPTGKYLVFPDLGADLVRVYSIDATTALLTEQPAIKSPSAYGPRHAAFWTSKNKKNATTYLFVIHELGNKVISYKVTYPAAASGSLSFTKVQEIGLYGDKPDPVGTRAAEITVSPDGNFVLASNRNATIYSLKNPDPSNSTAIPSDSLTTFKPCDEGKLTFVQNSPSGGSFPRHFKFNKDGSLVAVGNQNSQSVDVFARDIKTGKLGDRVASEQGLPGQITNVVWDEK